MASSVFVVCMVVFLACITVSPTADGTFDGYWKDHMGLMEAPTCLAKKDTPLSKQEADVFLHDLEKNGLSAQLAQLPYFCRQANLACSTNALEHKRAEEAGLPGIAWDNDKLKYDKETQVEEGELPYFKKSMVEKGRSIFVSDLRDPIWYVSFLPKTLALKVPFSSASLPSLKKLFGVVDGSSMDHYMQMILKMCGEDPMKGEWSKCATSGEDLVDLVVDHFGHQHLKVWSTESIRGSFKNVTIGDVSILHANLSSAPAICHSTPYVYQVYYCHVFPNVKVFAVEMRRNSKVVNHAIMACHYDTSAWNPKHVAFKLLKAGPGQTEVCHWINENGLVWSANSGV